MLYIALELVSDSVSRKLALVTMAILLIEIARKKDVRQYFVLLLIYLLTVGNIMLHGINYVVHQDYYGYALLLLICLFFSNESHRDELNALLSKKVIAALCVAFLSIVAASIFVKNGLRYSNEWGATAPFLYGPYELPHTLAYQLIVMYLIASIGWHKYGYIFLGFMLAFTALLAWTGVRSAFLVLAIILVCEYFSIPSVWKKSIIFIAVFMGACYALLFTDFLQNSPIIQKTLHAIRSGSGISNSRTDFNTYLTQWYFHGLNGFEKIFGVGMDRLREYMYLRYGTALHAHNDILNVLVGMGATGLFLYLKLFVDFCRVNRKWGYVFLPIFLLAFTNGLFLYTGVTPALPVFLVYFKVIKDLKAEEDETTNTNQHHPSDL